ncbi:MAG: hypothetical protein Q8P07_03630 [bacterium]|nr:hypothetical protein [bacterium]
MRTKTKVKGKIIFILIAGAVVLAAWFYFAVKSGNVPGKLDGFAQCLKEKGTVFYGAFWCPHCVAQKKLFGSSAKLLPYVECSYPNGRGQLQVCNEKNIKSYPTWDFADGERKEGEVSLADLSTKTGCALPE